jgi:hypothetical protein
LLASGSMNTPNVVRIECEGFSSAPLDSFKELQGELKTLPPAHFEALRTEIQEHGFSFAVHVWKGLQGDELHLLDGHQRIRTLKKMRDSGWAVPPIPYSLVDAKDYHEAKLKLLAGASQYGETSENGLAKFLQDVKIDPIKLAAQYPLPKLEMPKFLEKFMKPVALMDENDIGTGSAPLPGTHVAISAATATNHVKMVQLFFNEETFPQFMEMANKLQQHYASENLTDAVMEAIRADYSVKFSD